jgi:hypothetical protein
MAVCVLLLVCFIAGLVIRTRAGVRLNAQLERLILRRAPGFTFVKNIARGLAGLESGSDLSVALARIEDAWRPTASNLCDARQRRDCPPIRRLHTKAFCSFSATTSPPTAWEPSISNNCRAASRMVRRVFMGFLLDRM